MTFMKAEASKPSKVITYLKMAPISLVLSEHLSEAMLIVFLERRERVEGMFIFTIRSNNTPECPTWVIPY